MWACEYISKVRARVFICMSQDMLKEVYIVAIYEIMAFSTHSNVSHFLSSKNRIAVTAILRQEWEEHTIASLLQLF